MHTRVDTHMLRGPARVNSDKRHGPKSSNSGQTTAILLKHADSDFIISDKELK